MKRNQRLLVSVLSGVLLSLPWLGFPGWIIFVAFVPLLVLENFFVKKKDDFPEILFVGHVFLAAIIWNVAASWWMLQSSFLGVVSAMLFNAFLITLVWWASHFVRRNFSSGMGYIALVAFWISYEYLQFNWDLEWPCLQLGSILASSNKIIQWYEFTGTFGGTLWILLLNILLFRLIRFLRIKTSIQHSIATLFVFLTVLIVPLVASFFMYYSYIENEDPKQIAIVQPNVDPYLEKYDLKAENIKRIHFIRLAAKVCTDSTDFIVGPETVFENPDLWNEEKFDSNSFVLSLRTFLGQYETPELVFGASTFKVYPSKEEASITARNKDGVFYDRFSTAILLNTLGETQVYHKSKLVMGVEKTPFIRYFPFLKNLFIDLGGTSGTLGQHFCATNFVGKDGTLVAPVICFESVFGEYVTKYVKKGAQLIFVITNDGWWKGSRGYKQHLYFSQLRAIENRRSIARAANTGTSCFINQRGDVLQPTPWWQEAAISGTINTNNEITFYVAHGDYIGRIAVFVSVLFGLLVFRRRFVFKKGKKNPH